MASQVTVLGPSARRHVVKTTPNTYLNDVLEEACTKLRLDASQYGLKYNNKVVDLSRTIRLAGLPSGAKLDLVLLSRSPSAINVALELPESEAKDLPNGTRRLTEKFPSNTTLWLILRHFESSDKSGTGQARNYTARGVPRTGDGTSGAGRLYHESPVIQVMGRDLISFTDLQKTLGQLGLSGSVLLKLSFRTSDVPLEEAMAQIEQYFKSADEGANGGSNAGSVANTQSSPRPLQSQGEAIGQTIPDTANPSSQATDTGITPGSHEENQSSLPSPPPTDSVPQGASQDDPTVSENTGARPISIFAPSTSTTPQAALAAHDPDDYVPTIAHAQLHQSRLTSSTRNRRLPTDAELAAQEAAEAEKRSSVKKVEIKFKFPDEMTAIVPFTTEDTASDLYDFVTGLLSESKSAEPFLLTYPAVKGSKTVPRDSSAKLIGNLGLVGRVMVTFIWDEGASTDAKGGKVLKESVTSQARPIEIPKVADVAPADDDLVVLKQKAEPEGGKEKGKGMPKWLKGLAKK